MWDKLGVTGVGKCMQSKLINPHGNHPGLEKKPLLKQIADPANLDPKMPKAIQAAAAIKQQEDLAPQKIKAIKYLATMGCGCYQKTVDVRGALLEALDDCTEDVRLAAAKALCQVAGNPCSQCGGTCCNAETMNKLQEHASGKDANGCFKERRPKSATWPRRPWTPAGGSCRRARPNGCRSASRAMARRPSGRATRRANIRPAYARCLRRCRACAARRAAARAAAAARPPADLKKPVEVPAEPRKSSRPGAVRPPLTTRRRRPSL